MKRLLATLLLACLMVGGVGAASVVTQKIYASDSGVVTVIKNNDWYNITGPGEGAGGALDRNTNTTTLVYSNATAGYFQQNRRYIMQFVNSTPPDGGILVSARLHMWGGLVKKQELGYTGFGLVAVNTSIKTPLTSVGYYQYVEDAVLTSRLPYSSTVSSGDNILIFTQDGLSYINETGNTTIAVVSTWDNNRTFLGTWVSNKITQVDTVQASFSDPLYRPYLELNYIIPDTVSDETYSFMHYSDTQGMATDYPDQYNLTFSFVESLKSSYNITGIFITGDLTNGISTRAGVEIDHDYLVYSNATTYTTIPIFPIAGNHDVNNTANWTYWDLHIQDGPARHNYPFDYEDFTGYGFSWNGTTSTSGEDLGLNTSAKAEMVSQIGSNAKIPLILQHAYMDASGNLDPVGLDLRDSISRDAIVLSGHKYITSKSGNIIRQSVSTNGTRIIEDLFNLQSIHPAYYSGGRLYTVHKNTTGIINVTTTDFYIYPDVVINNTQTFTLFPLISQFTPSGPISVTYPNGVAFTDTSTGNPTAWEWYYDEDALGSPVLFNTSQNAYFAPPSTGNFLISLNASTSTDYDISTQVTWVNVSAAPPPPITNEYYAYQMSTHWNGTQGQETQQDDVGFFWPNVWTGVAIINTSTSKFGGSSLWLKTIGSAVISADSQKKNFNFSTGNWTVDWWSNQSYGVDLNDTMILSQQNYGTTDIMKFGYHYNSTTTHYQPFFSIREGNNLIADYNCYSNVIPGTWSHYAWTYNTTDNRVRCFHDGAYISSFYNATFNFPDYRGDVQVGRVNNTGAISNYWGFVGHIDEMHVIKGSSKYYDSFTPATTETFPHYILGSITYTPTYPAYAQSVQFNDSSMASPVVATWNWSFGDGGTATTQNPTHAFDSDGNYTVTLTTDNGYVTNVTSTVVSVGLVPSASFTATPTAGYIGDTFAFTDTSTGGTIDSWLWEFGDGGTSTSQNPAKSYSTAGTYTVNLTVTNTASNSNKTSVADYITVYNSSYPRAIFSCNPTSGSPSLLVSCTNITMGGVEPFEYNWSWGDGTTTISKFNPSHVYAYSGIYTVSLTVSNVIANATQTRANYITVSNNQNNVWYTQKQVMFKVLDYNNNVVPGVNVVATPTNTSLLDPNWLQTAYGISDEVAQQMIDSSLHQEALTGSSGEVTFTMHSSIEYTIVIDGAYAIRIYPIDTMYNVYVDKSSYTSLQNQQNYIRDEVSQNLTFYEPNSTHMTMGVDYRDFSGRTDYIQFWIVSKNNDTVMYSANQSVTGTEHVMINKTFANIRGDKWGWYYDAHHS